MSVSDLEGIRRRFVPMMRVVANEYAHRVPGGYPNIVDTPEAGAVGLELDPAHSVYITTDGEALFASPVNDRRPIAPDVSDVHLRNLVAELMSRWNQQPGIIHITDS